MIENAIYQILAAANAVTAVTGTNIFTGIAPAEDMTCYVVIHLIGITPENDKDGPSKLDQARVQVNSFHTEKATGDTLAALIRTALDRYRGSIGGFSIDKIVFQDARSDFDYEHNQYEVMQDFIVRQKRNV